MGSEVTATVLIQKPRSPPDHRVMATVIENRFNQHMFRSKTLEVCSGKPLRTSKALCVSERKKIRPQYVYPVHSRRGKRDKKENVNWVFNSSSKESRRTVSEWYIRDGFRTRRSPRPQGEQLTRLLLFPDTQWSSLTHYTRLVSTAAQSSHLALWSVMGGGQHEHLKAHRWLDPTTGMTLKISPQRKNAQAWVIFR